MASFSLEIYALLLGRNGEGQRALLASAVFQLPSAQYNKYGLSSVFRGAYSDSLTVKAVNGYYDGVEMHCFK